MNLKKIFFSLFIFVFASALTISHPPRTQAQGIVDTYESTLEIMGKIGDTTDALFACDKDGDYSLECLVSNVVTAGSHVGILILGGNPCEIPGNTSSQCAQAQGPQIIKGAAIPSVTNVIAYMYENPPAQTYQYIAYLKTKLAPQAYAQGVGYRSLSPIIEVWQIFRNIAYFFFVILFIITGFTIMFRTKIDPQTVISVQSALPRLVITLLLVTFSFAIVGFLIDMMYFLTFLGIRVIYSGLDANASAITDIFRNQNVISIFWKEFFSAPEFLGGSPGEGPFWSGITSFVAHTVNALFGKIITAASAGTLLNAGISAVLVLVLLIIIFTTLLRLLVTLISSFITIIVLAIFAPIMLLFNAVPGSNAFSNWGRNLLSNILVFPGVALFIAVSGLIIGTGPFAVEGVGYTNQTGTTLFNPPLLAYQSLEAVQAIIAFGLILMLPTVAQMIKDAFKVEPFKYGADLTARAATGAWPFRFLYEQSRERKAQQKEEQMLRRALSPQQG